MALTNVITIIHHNYALQASINPQSSLSSDHESSPSLFFTARGAVIEVQFLSIHGVNGLGVFTSTV